VKKKEALGGFTMMSGAVKKADGTRVLTWILPSRGNAPKDNKHG
jgi:hypothetical protein